MANKYQEYRADHIRLAFIVAFMDSPKTRRVDNLYISDGRRIRLERLGDGRIILDYLTEPKAKRPAQSYKGSRL